MQDEERIEGFVAVVLAGGTSQRMGRNKLLMEVAGRPMIRHVVETVRGVVEDVVVVTGHQPDRIVEALARLPVRILRLEPDSGETSTIAQALASVTPVMGTLLCVGDQPRLTGREITGLIEVYLAGGRERALVPMRRGRRGFPMIAPPNFDAVEVDLWAEDVALAHPERVDVFETRNPVYESSVDTPEDYRALFAI
jgi:CTP:molybdopterin cytidylyltransferase MocA